MYLKIKLSNYRHTAHNTVRDHILKSLTYIMRAVWELDYKWTTYSDFASPFWDLRVLSKHSDSQTKAGHTCNTHTWNEITKEWLQITQKHSGSYPWSIFYLFHRPSWEITQYNAIFLMCANKVKEKQIQLYTFVHFYSKSSGCLKFYRIHPNAIASEVDLDVHPCLQFPIGF